MDLIEVIETITLFRSFNLKSRVDITDLGLKQSAPNDYEDNLYDLPDPHSKTLETKGGNYMCPTWGTRNKLALGCKGKPTSLSF